MTRIFTILLLGALIFGAVGNLVPTVPAAGAAALLLASLTLESSPKIRSRFTESVEACALLESVAMCVGFGAIHLASQIGFLAVIPFLLRATAIKESAIRDSLALGTIILLSGWSERPGLLPTALTLVQAIASAGMIWYVIYSSGSTQTGTTVSISDGTTIGAPKSDSLTDESRVFELMERNRKLKASTDDLMRRSAVDRVRAMLMSWRTSDRREFKQLAYLIHQGIGGQGVALYAVPDSRKGFLLVCANGLDDMHRGLLEVSLNASPIVIRENAERAIRGTVLTNDQALETSLLIHKGRIAGLLCVVADSVSELYGLERILQETGPDIAFCLLEAKEREVQNARLQEAEMVAEFAHKPTAAIGIESALAVAGDLVEGLGIEGCVIWDAASDPPAALAQVGVDPLDLMSFGSMNGFAGWVRAGGKEILVENAKSDERFDRTAILRHGIGAVAVIPMISSGSLSGVLAVWTKESYGIGASHLRVLRAIIPLAVKKIFGGFHGSKPGLVDPDSFWELSQGPGSFVEVHFGTSVTDDSTELRDCRRKLLSAIMTRLPEGGIITRRPSGTVLAFLPGVDESRAERWAHALQPYISQKFGMKTMITQRESRRTFSAA